MAATEQKPTSTANKGAASLLAKRKKRPRKAKIGEDGRKIRRKLDGRMKPCSNLAKEYDSVAVVPAKKTPGKLSAMSATSLSSKSLLSPFGLV